MKDRHTDRRQAKGKTDRKTHREERDRARQTDSDRKTDRGRHKRHGRVSVPWECPGSRAQHS